LTLEGSDDLVLAGFGVERDETAAEAVSDGEAAQQLLGSAEIKHCSVLPLGGLLDNDWEIGFGQSCGFSAWGSWQVDGVAVVVGDAFLATQIDRAE
jgi:hypothetical protein